MRTTQPPGGTLRSAERAANPKCGSRDLSTNFLDRRAVSRNRASGPSLAKTGLAVSGGGTAHAMPGALALAHISSDLRESRPGE
jgi:hypothetical protein